MPGTEGMLLAASFIQFSSSQKTPTSRVTQEFKLEDCEEQATWLKKETEPNANWMQGCATRWEPRKQLGGLVTHFYAAQKICEAFRKGTYGEGKTLVLSRLLLMTMVAKLVPGDGWTSLRNWLGKHLASNSLGAGVLRGARGTGD